MTPPVQSAASGAVGDPAGLAMPPQLPAELPVTIKPPGLPEVEVLLRMMPFAPPFAETLVNVMLSGVLVAALTPVISTAGTLVALSVPAVVVIAPVLFCARNGR